MKDALCNEWLFFCSRGDLESLQLVRKFLLHTIVARSNALPLRSIYHVNVNHWDPLDKIEIFVEGDRHKAELIPDYETSFRDGDFAEAFCRLQHSYIKLFSIGIEDSPFLRYWEAQKAADLTIVSIDFEPSETLDNDVLDSIVNLLQPRTIDVSFEHCLSQWWEDQTAPYNSKYLGVLARASFVNSLQTCPLNLWRGAFPPPSFVFNEPGYPNYELKCHHTNVADGIDAFIESFARDGCANKKLQSVCITWSVWPDGQWPHGPSPMSKLLSNPTTSDEPLPEDVKLRSISGVRVLSQCEVHTFVNEKQKKRMEVYKWSVKYFEDEDRWTTHVLKCLVKNV
ncbi:hypothetical protein AAVH_28357 [Aphelenchoides avenae]|nr:hypothetical protein AAVH_28357 [Aphelenchus avenae]